MDAINNLINSQFIKHFLATIVFLFLHLGILAQTLVHPFQQQERLLILAKEENFNTIKKILGEENFQLTKQESEIDLGDYFLISKLEFQKRSGTLYGKKPDFKDLFTHLDESISIENRSYGGDKEFTIHHFVYTTLSPCYFNFISFCKEIQDKETSYTQGLYGKRIDTNILINRARDGISVTRCDSEFRWLFSKPNFFRYGISSEKYDLPFYEFRDIIFFVNYDIKQFYAQKSSNGNILKVPLLKIGNTYYLELNIGGKIMKYVLDSGASDLSMSKGDCTKYYPHELKTAVEKKYSIANGETISRKSFSTNFSFFGIELKGINILVVEEGEPLLLGKSVLDKFKSWKIDNKNNELILEIRN